MQLAQVDFSSIQYYIAVLASICDFDHHDHASVEQAIREPIKVTSKVALRLAYD